MALNTCPLGVYNFHRRAVHKTLDGNIRRKILSVLLNSCNVYNNYEEQGYLIHSTSLEQ